MKLIDTNLKGLYVVEPRIFADSRGYFFESYNFKQCIEKGIDIRFVQDNQSKSSYGVIRGLHYQSPPYAQTKLVRVLQGDIYDVVVDIRKNSPTFGKWFGIELTSENNLQLLVPKGFAHGFSVISETAVVFYKCDDFYNTQSERGIRYNDTTLNIDWKVKKGSELISAKDAILPSISEIELVFE